MLLGHVASKMGSKFNVVVTVTGMLSQRLFHPVSALDCKIVGELGRIAAHTGVWKHGGMGVWNYGCMNFLPGSRDNGCSRQINEPVTGRDLQRQH